MENSLQSSVFSRQPSRILATEDSIDPRLRCSSSARQVIIVGTHQRRKSLSFHVKQFTLGVECVRPRNAAGAAAILDHGAGFEEG